MKSKLSFDIIIIIDLLKISLIVVLTLLVWFYNEIYMYFHLVVMTMTLWKCLRDQFSLIKFMSFSCYSDRMGIQEGFDTGKRC